MWLWKKKQQPFINGTSFLKKKVKGSAGIYIISLMVILFFCLLLLATYYRKRTYITYDTVDDSIVSALTSACTFNLEAYGYGGQVVIYDVPPIEPEVEELPLPGATPPPELTPEEEEELAYQKALDNLNNTALLLPMGDKYLDKSYSDFMKALKRNLKLDDTMQSSLSGIEGVVIVDEFSVYNRFEEFTEDGALIAYRIIKYTYSNGTWSVYPFNINTPVTIYNSYDKAESYVEDTTVTAKLTLNIRIGQYNAEYMPGLSDSDMVQTVFYQRLVDIKKN